LQNQSGRSAERAIICDPFLRDDFCAIDQEIGTGARTTSCICRLQNSLVPLLRNFGTQSAILVGFRAEAL
jgi:hypothetical protein